MLRVILKLDDVELAIVGFQQMRLGAAPHLSDETAGVYRHALRGEARVSASQERYDARRNEASDAAAAKDAAAKNRDEVALELMKFIAVTTGYGKGNTTARAFRESRRNRRKSTRTR